VERYGENGHLVGTESGGEHERAAQMLALDSTQIKLDGSDRRTVPADPAIDI
jgi:hypothetical protein